MGKRGSRQTPPAEPNPFLFPSGDVTLKATYDNKPIVGSVSSKALCLASPVWSKFLYPPWGSKEAAAKPTESIDCSEDDGEALLVLLNIAHLRFRKVPTKLAYPLLLKVAILCDQYHCLEIVQPWLSNWMQDESSESQRKGQEGWLFIAWVFGREDTFKEACDLLVRELKYDSLDRVVNSDGLPLPEPMPLGIIESILAVRKTAIESLVSIPHNRLKNWELLDPSAKTICREPHNDRACDMINYASLTIALKRAGLFTQGETQHILMSVNELKTVLCEMHIEHFPRQQQSRGYFGDHDHCGFPTLGAEIKAAEAAFPCPVLESHILHMKAARVED